MPDDNAVALLLSGAPTQDRLEAAHSALSQRNSELTRDEKRLLAEVSFLLASHWAASGRAEQRVIALAQESLSLYMQLDIKSLVEAQPILWRYLPDAMHDGVVRARLGRFLT